MSEDRGERRPRPRVRKPVSYTHLDVYKRQGLTMVNVPSFWQYVAKVALLLFALTSDYIRKQNRERQLLEASKKNG